MGKQSLGLIETWGYIPAIEAADAGTKTANVILLGYEVTKTALVTVKFMGDVAAVKAAVDAGAARASKVGKVVAVHVIPRPDRQLRIGPPDRSPSRKKKPVEIEPQRPLEKIERKDETSKSSTASVEKKVITETAAAPEKVKKSRSVKEDTAPLDKKKRNGTSSEPPSGKKKSKVKPRPRKTPAAKGKKALASPKSTEKTKPTKKHKGKKKV